MEKLHFKSLWIIVIVLSINTKYIKANYCDSIYSIIGNWYYFDCNKDSLYVECYFRTDSTYVTCDLDAGIVQHKYNLENNNLLIFHADTSVFKIKWETSDEFHINNDLKTYYFLIRLNDRIDLPKISDDSYNLKNEFMHEFILRSKKYNR